MPASRSVGSVFRQTAGVAKFYSSAQQRSQQEIHAYLDQIKPAAELYRREAHSAQPKHRREAETFPIFEGATGHGDNVAHLLAQSSQTQAGTAQWREDTKMIKQSCKPSKKVFGGIESCLWHTFGSKAKLQTDLTRSMTTSNVLEIREPEIQAREEEGQHTALSEEGVTENSVRQNLRSEELLRKVKARLKDCGTKDGSKDAAQGNGRRHIHRAGTAREAIALLERRVQQGIPVDSYAYVKVLQMCLKQKDLVAIKQIHDCIIKSGMEKNKYVASSLLSLYIKCGGMLEARRVFDALGNKTVITWNMMIAGYAKSDLAKSALELFKTMRQEGVRPNEVTYLCIVKACASPLAIKWGKEVHECIQHAGFESDVRVGSALVHMYAEGGSIDDAQQLFNRMPKRNVVTWNTMIGGLAQNGRGHEAYRLFLQMKHEGLEPNTITYVNILNPNARAGALQWMKEVHGHASKAGLESDVRVGSALVRWYAESGSLNDAQLVFDRMQKRDVVAWTLMIGGLAQHGRGHEAYKLFLQMKHEGCKPDAFMYSSILNASSCPGALEWVKEVHGHACRAGLESDLRVGSALVRLYAEGGCIDEARLVFDRMQKRDVVTWNIMIGGLAQHGCGHEALELFRKMNADLVKPNEVTFLAVLSACCHGGLLEDGRRHFSAMVHYGVEPKIKHYNSMVDLLGRAGHLVEAKRFISEMPVEPDSVTWKTLLGACRTHGNVELGELAAKEVFKLEPNDAASYVLLSNIYAAAGKSEEEEFVRALMRKMGVRKDPGRSWIEVDNNIHEFFVGDNCHPEAKAIYSYLKELTEKLKAEGYIPDTQLVSRNVDEETKELALCSHSERLAIAYGLMRGPQGEPIRVHKNLRVCPDCHTATKFISKVTGREIIARDAIRFHHFKDGVCSCGDYW